MLEYDQAFAGYYEFLFPKIEDLVQFYVEEATKTGSPVLELGCGTGRTLIPIAESDISIVGLDCSTAMLSVAKRKISETNLQTQSRIELIEGDMRHFSFDRKFKLITIPDSAFLHLSTPEDQRHTLECVRRHLRQDGRLILDIIDPRFEILAEPLRAFGSSLRLNTEFTHSETGRRVVVWFFRWIDPTDQKTGQEFIFEELDSQGKVLSKIFRPFTFRYAFRFEMKYLLELSGFVIESLYGGFRRAKFNYGCPQVWIARPT